MLDRTGYPEAMAPQPSDLKTIDLTRVISLIRRQAWVLAICMVFVLALAAFYL
ncbi:MAG: hypothetical protein HY371_03245, partial [Devosia nanyangense]|nr:hypothetical protein [Devosia nanyangense]